MVQAQVEGVQVFQVREQAQQAQKVGEADFRSSEQRTSLLRPAACSTRTWLSGKVCTRPTHHMGTHHLFASAKNSRFIRLPFAHQCGREPVLSLEVADNVPQQFGNEDFVSHVPGLLLRAVDAELCSILLRLSHSSEPFRLHAATKHSPLPRYVQLVRAIQDQFVCKAEGVPTERRLCSNCASRSRKHRQLR